MQQFSLCFGKVKKDCLKFIKSQETKADKFKNKERMIKSFLIGDHVLAIKNFSIILLIESFLISD